jgi:cob(I)alamin adenosyltransferase
MDLYSQELPELKQFILPGGTKAASVAHVARTVCRRCERLVVELQESEPVASEIVIYLNRLSDYLFMLSRYWNHLAQVSDVFWKHD